MYNHLTKYYVKLWSFFYRLSFPYVNNEKTFLIFYQYTYILRNNILKLLIIIIDK
jgi:hypothetical protein